MYTMQAARIHLASRVLEANGDVVPKPKSTAPSQQQSSLDALPPPSDLYGSANLAQPIREQAINTEAHSPFI